jgi:hypothetical protein
LVSIIVGLIAESRVINWFPKPEKIAHFGSAMQRKRHVVLTQKNDDMAGPK